MWPQNQPAEPRSGGPAVGSSMRTGPCGGAAGMQARSRTDRARAPMPEHVSGMSRACERSASAWRYARSIAEHGPAFLQEGGCGFLGVRVLGELRCQILLVAIAVAQAHVFDGVERSLGQPDGRRALGRNLAREV